MQNGAYMQQAPGGTPRWIRWIAELEPGGWVVKTEKNGGLHRFALLQLEVYG